MFELTSPTMRKEFQLHSSDADDIRSFIHNCISGISRARLHALAGLFAPLFGKYRVLFPARVGELTRESVVRLVRGLTPPSLEQTREAFAVLFANPENVMAAFKELPRAYYRVIEILCSSVFISADTIRRLIEENLDKIVVPDKKGYPAESYISFDGITAILQRVNQYSLPDCFTIEFGLLRHIGTPLRLGLFANAKPRTCDVLPDIPLTVTDTSDGLTSIFHALSESIRNGEIEISSSNDVVKAGSVKVFSLTHSLPEFFQNSSVKQLRNLRMRDCISMFRYRWRRNSGENGSPAQAVRDMISHFHADPYFFASLALPYYTGFRKGMFINAEYAAAYSMIESLLKNQAVADKERPAWIDARDIACHVFSTLKQQGRYLIDVNQISVAQTSVTNSITGEVLTRLNLVNTFTLQAIYGLMAIMCSVGIIDMAVAPQQSDSPTPFDTIKYVRLSRFGRYVTGLDTSYTPKITDTQVNIQCELDPERLIITTFSAAAATIVKSQFGNAIGNNRFIATEGSFMRRGRTPALLAAQIEKLKSLAGINTLPKVWADFFDTLKHRFNAFKPQPLYGWCMFEINPECPGLASLLTSNQEIRELIRLVEGNSFIVKRDDIVLLGKILRDHGYPAPEAEERYFYYY